MNAQGPRPRRAPHPRPPSRESAPLSKSERQAKEALKRRVRGKPAVSGNPLSFGRFSSMFFLQSFKIFVVAALLLGFLLFGLGSGMLGGYISTAQRVKVSDIRKDLSNERTVILDMHGQPITTLKGAGSTSEFVPISELKDSYIDDAFIAIEDERFESHPGIDAKRIASAVISALMNGGTPTHGGSTITQQTIKLISGADDLSAQRKIQEWYNAVRLEQSRSKDSIMELYLNLVPMANNYEGVQAAAKAYFNKPAAQLSLAESALLAGIPNRPATYNPMTEYGRRNALRRMRMILGLMLEHGRIGVEAYEAALHEEIVFDFSAQDRQEEQIYNWFVDYVIREVKADLVAKKGYSEELAQMALYRYGLTIETTMDPSVQSKLEKVFADGKVYYQDPAQIPDSPEDAEASITVMDNLYPGMIRGLVGGFGEKKGNFVFNRAVDAKRQPGSAIKPILVYAPALETGVISQATPFDDREIFLDPHRPDTPYPLNYSRRYEGPVSLEYAILYSLNTIAAETYLTRLGPEVGLSFLNETGIDRRNEPYVAGALGGFEQGMSSLEMTGAFSTLATEGLYHRPISYSRVLNHDGSILLDNSQEQARRVYRPETTYVTTTMLRKVAEASWNSVQPHNTVAAGKTGTTENYTDVWFCGYTPYYTAAVWYGYDNAHGRRTAIPEIDGKNACIIWRESMNALHEDKPLGDFPRPAGVVNAEVCQESGMLAGPYCEDKMTVLLIEGAAANPTEICTLHEKPPAPSSIFPFGPGSNNYQSQGGFTFP